MDIFNKAITPWCSMPKKQRKAIKAQADAGATVDVLSGNTFWKESTAWPHPVLSLPYRIRPGTEKDLTPASEPVVREGPAMPDIHNESKTLKQNE